MLHSMRQIGISPSYAPALAQQTMCDQQSLAQGKKICRGQQNNWYTVLFKNVNFQCKKVNSETITFLLQVYSYTNSF